MTDYYIIQIIGLVMMGVVIGGLATYVIIIPQETNRQTIRELCASKLNYTNSEIQDFNSCLWNPEFYGIDR